MTAIRLPWPSKMLSQNARIHWRARSSHTKAARLASHWATVAAGLHNLDAVEVSMSITFAPPDKRRRDVQNCIGSIKAHIDGIADALGVDDSKFAITYPPGFAAPVKDGAVIVEITGFRRAK